jgi:hypothetical protein
VFDPHRLWVGLSIAAAQAHCPYISDVKDLRCWTAVTGISIKDIKSVARTYTIMTGRDAVKFDVREVEQMTEKLLRMVGENADFSSQGQAAGKKLWSFVRRKSVKHSV